MITFITICAVQSRMLLSVLGSEQELFNEHATFPIVYRLVKLHHEHSNQKSLTSILRSVRSAHPNLFKELQYAPLYESFTQNKKEKADKVPTNNTATPTATPIALRETTKIITEEKTGHFKGKSHLEPRTDATSTKYQSKEKVETATPVSRSPGHNAVYKIIFPTEEGRKSIKVF